MGISQVPQLTYVQEVVVGEPDQVGIGKLIADGEKDHSLFLLSMSGGLI